MRRDKPKWSKPKLIVLARAKHEERVLSNCKGVPYASASGAIYTNCYWGCPAGCNGTGSS
jgi:hypothetical protein